jgi:hypothetical protein
MGAATDSLTNPLDVIEDLISEHGWPVERQSDGELTAAATGRWCNYQLWFSCREDPGALQFSCAFDMKVPTELSDDIAILLARVNERMWLGHFDHWSDEGLLMYHHAMLLGGEGVGEEQCRDLVDVALDECERFYPAFYTVLERSLSPKDAVEVAILDACGEA